MKDLLFIGGKPAFALDKMTTALLYPQDGSVQDLWIGYEDDGVKRVKIPFQAVLLMNGNTLWVGMN
jgi:hypothetical protein